MTPDTPSTTLATGALEGDRFANPYPPRVGQVRDDQLPTPQSWDLMDDQRRAEHGAQIIHIRPYGSSTTTVVNPMEPDPDGYRVPPGVDHPALRPIPAGRYG